MKRQTLQSAPRLSNLRRTLALGFSVDTTKSGWAQIVVTENCAPIIRVSETTEMRRGNQHQKTSSPRSSLARGNCSAGRSKTRPHNVAGPSNVSWRPLKRSQKFGPKIIPTNELSTLRPRVAPSIVVGRATSRYALAQTQAGTLPHTPGDTLVYWGGTRDSPRNCHATTQILLGTQIFRRQSARLGLSYLP